MNKIKVLHFVSGLVSGGVEEMLCNYCKFMNHENYEFVVVYQHDPIETCKKKIETVGCRTVRITARSENFFKNIFDSIKIIENEKPDIVHAHMNLMNFCALYAAKRKKVKVRISHAHIAEKNRGKIFRLFGFVCKKLCRYYATALYTCGLEAGEYLYGKRMLKTNQVTLVENAIDLEYFMIDEENREKFRKENNLLDKFVVGHVGRFSYQKNHERLIHIFVELLKLKENSILLLVGAGEKQAGIVEMVDELGISEKVIFYGTTNNMNKVYSMMDVFVLPSYFEGFPVVSLEVQAADLPAVFSDAIDRSCQITNAVNFMSLDKSNVEWAEKINSVYENRKENSLDNLKYMFDIREKAKRLENYYEELIINCSM